MLNAVLQLGSNKKRIDSTMQAIFVVGYTAKSSLFKNDPFDFAKIGVAVWLLMGIRPGA